MNFTRDWSLGWLELEESEPNGGCTLGSSTENAVQCSRSDTKVVVVLFVEKRAVARQRFGQAEGRHPQV